MSCMEVNFLSWGIAEILFHFRVQESWWRSFISFVISPFHSIHLSSHFPLQSKSHLQSPKWMYCLTKSDVVNHLVKIPQLPCLSFSIFLLRLSICPCCCRVDWMGCWKHELMNESKKNDLGMIQSGNLWDQFSSARCSFPLPLNSRMNRCFKDALIKGLP